MSGISELLICGKVKIRDHFTRKRSCSSKHQIVVPREARDKLHIGPGQELLVLCKEDRIVLIPKPCSYTQRTAGLHKKIWRGGAANYLAEERGGWDK